jgi:hypothetical protein
MNKRDYREGRVKVSDKIKGAIVELIIREKDIERKKKHPANWYRNEIAEALKLTDRDNPSLRSYESIIQPIRKSLQSKNPLEEPWSLGVLSKYKDDFPPEIIPVLIKVRKLQMQNDWEGPRVLTIRQAQWIARLYHLIREISMRRHLDEEDLFMVWVITEVYAKREEMDEIIGKKYLDSSGVDKEIFFTEHFWELPIDGKAAFCAATQSLYLAVQKNYGHDRTKKHGNNDNFSGKESS